MGPIFPIKGIIQNYQWGGYDYLARLLRHTKGTEPQAEYWLGAHPSAPSQIIDSSLDVSEYLKSTEMPLNFLLKILDVRDMLSIQVHPNRRQALNGFSRENNLDIAINASHRNYKDHNHKPELMVALSDFWLLHGIKDPAAITQELNKKPYLKPLAIHLEKNGISSAFQYLLDSSDPEIKTMTEALLQDITMRSALEDKQQADFWVQRWLSQNPTIHSGLFALYFLNIVHIPAGQGIYQPSGLLHAYLEGINVELMANSDNVLRAGLTPKHIDAEELLSIANLSPTDPNDFIALKQTTDDLEIRYLTPFKEFELRELNGFLSNRFSWFTQDLEILICISGSGTVEPYCWQSGDAFLIDKGAHVDLDFSVSKGLIYKAINL